MIINFTVPGQPIGNQRVSDVINKHTGLVVKGQKYLPKKSRNNQDAIAWYLKKAMGKPFQPTAKPIRLGLVAYFEIPESWPDWKKRMALDHDILPTVKPDMDNILKAVKDALNKIAWRDDAQVTEFSRLGKYYSDTPRLEIDIEVIDKLPANANRRDAIANRQRKIDLFD